MSYLAELHAAHKARIARMGGKAPKLERKVMPNSADGGPARTELQGREVMPLAGAHTPIEVQPASEPVAPVRAPIPRSAQWSFLMARDIVRITCAAFNVPVYSVMAHDRREPICQARQVAVFLIKKHTKISWTKVGNFLGGYDTSSLRHSRCKIRRMLESDPALMSIIENIEREIAELPCE